MMICSVLAGILLVSGLVQGKFHIDKRGNEVIIVEESSVEKRPVVGGSTSVDCPCQCRKLHSNRGWECCQCVWTDEVCFPGDAHVQLESGDSIPMSSLSIGQKVLTIQDDGTPVFTEVLTFLKRHPQTDAVYWAIRTEKASIRMTPRHVVFMSATNDTATRQPRFAQDLSLGDYLFSANPSNITPSEVLEISSQIMKGVYVPLTETGTLVVDGILASCYSSISHHIAHAFLTPVRWFPSIFRFEEEDYGMPSYVTFVKWLGHRILPSTYQGRYGPQKSLPGHAITGSQWVSIESV